MVNMKQKIFKIIAIFLIFGLLLGCYFKIQDNARYKINSPMQDIEYKKKIIKSSKDKSYTLENMRPIVGPQELLQFISENDNNPQIYTPSDENIKNGIFSANLHIHTLYSDGQMTIRQLLDKAQDYAKDFPDGKYMYVAVTDHNTILGTQNLIFTLQKNPNRYTKIKVVPGIEIFTKFNSKYSNKLIDIHVLTWCINPYDKFLEKEFYKADLSDRYNYKYRDFDEVIRIMKNHGIVGVAHPARYVSHLKKDKYAYIEEMLGRLKQTSENVFTEGYYQTYPVLPDKEELGNEYEEFLEHINKTAKNYGIIRTGSTDTHGYSIFRK